MIREVEFKYREAWFFLAGDWNSRTGSGSDLFLHFGNLKVLPELCSYSRLSKDSLVNAAGLLLAEFCIIFGFVWLNGLSGFDNVGEFTFLAPQGASVIDYILVSSPLLPHVSEFNVGPPLLSDHLPLSCLITLSPTQPLLKSFPNNKLSSPPLKNIGMKKNQIIFFGFGVR